MSSHREPTGAPPLHVEVAIVLGVVFAGLVVYALPDLRDWIAGRAPEPAAVHALALGECRIPTEHEQLHIVISHRRERLVSTCMYAGTRGTYTRRP